MQNLTSGFPCSRFISTYKRFIQELVEFQEVPVFLIFPGIVDTVDVKR